LTTCINKLLKQISIIDELAQIPNRRGLKNYIYMTLKYYGKWKRQIKLYILLKEAGIIVLDTINNYYSC
jgi:GGDEF domain-containing protein